MRKAIIAAAVAAAALVQPALRAGTCTVNGGTTYQTIDGFGFASVYASTLTSAQANTFFGTGSGQLGVSLLRVHISSTGGE